MFPEEACDGRVRPLEPCRLRRSIVVHPRVFRRNCAVLLRTQVRVPGTCGDGGHRQRHASATALGQCFFGSHHMGFTQVSSKGFPRGKRRPTGHVAHRPPVRYQWLSVKKQLFPHMASTPPSPEHVHPANVTLALAGMHANPVTLPLPYVPELTAEESLDGAPGIAPPRWWPWHAERGVWYLDPVPPHGPSAVHVLSGAGSYPYGSCAGHNPARTVSRPVQARHSAERPERPLARVRVAGPAGHARDAQGLPGRPGGRSGARRPPGGGRQARSPHRSPRRRPEAPAHRAPRRVLAAPHGQPRGRCRSALAPRGEPRLSPVDAPAHALRLAPREGAQLGLAVLAHELGQRRRRALAHAAQRAAGAPVAARGAARHRRARVQPRTHLHPPLAHPARHAVAGTPRATP